MQSVKSSIISEERNKLIDQLRLRGITDENVLAIMNSLPRERFVGGGFEKKAYEDSALPIGLQQTISQPYTVAFMTQMLQIQPGKKSLKLVREVGIKQLFWQN